MLTPVLAEDDVTVLSAHDTNGQKTGDNEQDYEQPHFARKVLI